MNIIYLIFGLVGSIYFYLDIQKANATNNWKVTYATLDHFETPSYWVNKNGVEKECKHIKTKYSYTYNNDQYFNHQISLIPQSTIWAHQVENLVQKKGWKQGNEIIIYVNPDNPSESVMLRGTKEVGTDTWIGLAFFLLLLTTGIVGCIRSLYNFFIEIDSINTDENIH